MAARRATRDNGCSRGHRRQQHRGRGLPRRQRWSGSAYVLRTSDGGATYVEVAKLTAADAAAEDWFGIYVAIDGNAVVVGARYDDDAGSMSGSAYVFLTTDGGATYDQDGPCALPTPRGRPVRRLRGDRR